ncbi:SWIRM domain-containing protein [Helicostylum pulchrum]|nr:SWIRM domain-containing protein [Helicostylum pulchrum]
MKPKKKKRVLESDSEEGEVNNKKAKTPKEPTQDEIALQFMPVQQHEVIIPSYAAWFDISTIHSIETRGLPEFFNNKNKSKNPSVYKDYRDFMINTYRLNPLEYLTVTACRRNMTGDVCAIIRVHAFLEQWGLINYQMDPTAKPTAIGPPFEGQVKIIAELPPGLNKYASEQVNLIENVEEDTTATTATTTTIKETSPPPPPPTATTSLPTPPSSSSPKPAIDMNLDLRADIYEATTKACKICDKKVEQGYGNGTKFICKACYESEESKQDYKRQEAVEQWTEQEKLLLLEGLEMFPTNWDAIAKHVCSKTRDECILHYLKLPTADPRIDPQVKKLGLLNFDQKEQVDNPIMSVVAFLASHVNPNVAASSIHQSEEEEDQKQRTSNTESEMDQESEQLEATYNLIRTKISSFNSRMDDFEQIEALVNEQRRDLEKEKILIRQDHLSIRNQMDHIYHVMFQRRQEKILEEQQKQKEDMMPNDIVVKLPNDTMTPEEKEYQDNLRVRYPIQYLQRQHQLAAARNS